MGTLKARVLQLNRAAVVAAVVLVVLVVFLALLGIIGAEAFLLFQNALVALGFGSPAVIAVAFVFVVIVTLTAGCYYAYHRFVHL